MAGRSYSYCKHLLEKHEERTVHSGGVRKLLPVRTFYEASMDKAVLLPLSTVSFSFNFLFYDFLMMKEINA